LVARSGKAQTAWRVSWDTPPLSKWASLRMREPSCLEQYASATAVVRMAAGSNREQWRVAAAQAAGSDPSSSAKSIYNLAIQGDEDARRIFRYGRSLPGHCAFVAGEFLEPADLRDWWRSFERMGRPFHPPSSKSCGCVPWCTPPPRRMILQETDRGASAHVQPGPGHKTIVTRALLGSDAGLYARPAAHACGSKTASRRFALRYARGLAAAARGARENLLGEDLPWRKLG